MKKLLYLLNEIGEEQTGYPIQNEEAILNKLQSEYKQGNHEMDCMAKFVTKDDIPYAIVIDLGYGMKGYEMEVGFGILMGDNRVSVDYDTQTNKQDAIMIIATVLNFLREIGKIIPIQEVFIKPSKTEGEENLNPLETKRGRLYVLYAKKFYPNATITTGSKSIRIKLNN
jgi:hypothetical protein